MVVIAVMNLEVKVAQASRRHFGPGDLVNGGLLKFLLSMPREGDYVRASSFVQDRSPGLPMSLNDFSQMVDR